MLLRLRPLVDAGLIFPVVMQSFHHCEQELAFIGRMIDTFHGAAREAAKDFQSEFRIRYQLPEKSPTGLSTAYLEGPKDFLEHGSGVETFNEGRDGDQRVGATTLREWSKFGVAAR